MAETNEAASEQMPGQHAPEAAMHDAPAQSDVFAPGHADQSDLTVLAPGKSASVPADPTVLAPGRMDALAPGRGGPAAPPSETRRITPRSPRAALEPERVRVPTRASRTTRHPLVIAGNAVFTV
jgi:hypothetical protein